jgi:hypothetical protein
MPRISDHLDGAGWAAAAILSAGAVFTALRLVG